MSHVAGIRRSRGGSRRRSGPASADAARSAKLVIPSALTIFAVCAGLTAVKLAAEGRVDLALVLVVSAAALDGVDGRIARMIHATSKIGAELDSLADAINFGVVPALILASVLLKGHDLGWAIVLVYCCAIILRLARFNTLNDDENAPGYYRDFFVGVPAPAAALIALGPVGLHEGLGDGWWSSLPVVGGWTLLAAFLAISRIPTSSLKATTKLSRSALAPALILVAGAAALLVTYPYTLMTLLIAAYLAHIPFAWWANRWVEARPEHWDSLPSERRSYRRMTSKRRPSLRKSQARLGLRRPPTGK
ncbi:MAG TPA: phosphatidylcholine/phosphatidylserine synthase [Gordonia sp. (in: high G+C Gram-positive bacteria)]|uniref:CDP-alcohol phosphatidyltransferase family protein n=1 Tax=unclassified Gordonia (in: high G+C Gram-positive bacteria) TaxID=2657482 RepID=UPI000FAE97CB|nr:MULTISPECIES: phosphatidylcholine/phosphatidylserine synthase [unclassified Gordonia (in: high G+C Gram-positive bacteria)]RUP40048.1 MAG: phosphatidylcholine/phosphatidylserine synthase [Gordonia sp. (in: high G+C Gram-positive bacteria)]HNP57157.1 phosphatidylcholine/phosphatidylserine synthase [Gordonia sp. (in: high G+C Gram-positive bacteria)]HRC50523.1 phosphatidylcholine/phosphatidylserine synthase [Gordonia sp. (in: high G+C Gram-positive bacteria)]